MRPVFDVSAYGAAGDGVTNDHDAIVRALYREYLPTQFGLHRVPRFDPDEGAVLRFGPGRYRIEYPTLGPTGQIIRLSREFDWHPGRAPLVIRF